MIFDCFSFKKLCFISFISFSLLTLVFGQEIDKEKARKFEALATHACGVLADIPEDIRLLRSGPVEQRVTITDDGFLLVGRAFHCRPFTVVPNPTKPVKATSVKKFALADFKDNPLFRFTINRHSNSIQLSDKACEWILGFQSTADTEKAFILLKSLIATACKPSPSQSFSCAEAARSAGYSYLIAGARCEGVEEAVQLVSMSEASPRLLCWLTKKNPQDIEGLFTESTNRLPLFIYDLSVLDSAPFFTESIPGNTSFLPCSIGTPMLQSVSSDDKKGFEAFLKNSPFVGIRFESLQDLLSPIAVLCRANDEHKIRKTAHSMKMHMRETRWCFTTVLDDAVGIPRGTTSLWVTGISDNSYDILRHCLFRTELTPALFAYTIYPEFPMLKKLLKMKSRYHKDLTIEEMVCRTSHALEQQAKKIPEFDFRVLRFALLTHELGSPFGPDSEIGYNTWPIALAIAEKVGIAEPERRALQALIEGTSTSASKQGEKKKKEDSLFLAFLCETRTADEIGISIQAWLQLKARFYGILSLQGKLPNQRQGELRFIKSIKERYSAILPFGVTRGALCCHGPLKTRHLYSSYVWEGRDPLHRDGLSLKRRREKFERMIVDCGKTTLKGHFWEWLNKELQDGSLLPNYYLNDKEREQYRARFDDGVLVFPKLPSKEDVEMMFVLDEWGRLYIGMKNDGERPDEKGFNHASFLGGRPVASAGKLIFREGRVIGITDHSGHYRCGRNELALALEALQKMGVTINQVHVVPVAP
jgi:hypothetical protein